MRKKKRRKKKKDKKVKNKVVKKSKIKNKKRKNVKDNEFSEIFKSALRKFHQNIKTRVKFLMENSRSLKRKL